jgi:hypothetical protein
MSRPMAREETVVEAPVTTVTVPDYPHQAYMILSLRLLSRRSWLV